MGNHSGGTQTGAYAARARARVAAQQSNVRTATLSSKVFMGKSLRGEDKALSAKLDTENHQAAGVTKARIAKSLGAALARNIDYQALVAKLDAKGQNPTRAASQLLKAWSKGPTTALSTRRWAAIQMAVHDEFHLNAPLHIDARLVTATRQEYAAVMPGLRAYVREMYNQTQAWFKSHGITSVPAYRGMKWAEGKQPANTRWDDAVHRTRVASQPATSFSVSLLTANMFGGAYGSQPRPYTTTVAARIPVERVLSTAMTGFGAKFEGEMVVLGSKSDSVLARSWQEGHHSPDVIDHQYQQFTEASHQARGTTAQSQGQAQAAVVLQAS